MKNKEQGKIKLYTDRLVDAIKNYFVKRSKQKNIVKFQEYKRNKLGVIDFYTYVELHKKEIKLSLKQKIAYFLKNNNIFMNVSFINKFVHKQLDTLIQENKKETNKRENFIIEISKYNKYRYNYQNKNCNLQNTEKPNVEQEKDVEKYDKEKG